VLRVLLPQGARAARWARGLLVRVPLVQPRLRLRAWRPILLGFLLLFLLMFLPCFLDSYYLLQMCE
jgi:hypothetical protein